MRHTVWNEICTREHLSWDQLETGMWPGVRHTDIIMRKLLPDSGGFLFFLMSLWLFAAEMEALNHSVTSQHPVEKHLHLMVLNLFSRG